jgi:putative tryptophan/tyrosine transport system substrate-binding protein
MRRREVIALFGAAAASSLLRPLDARAQQPALPVIGFLNAASPQSYARELSAFLKGLSEAGYVEGRNVAIEYRWAEGRSDRLPALAADLVQRQVAVIAATSTPAALAAKAATATVPIVFAIGANPVALGLVASLNNPGGNVTGVSFQNTELQTKALELLRELAPQAVRIVALVNPQSAFTEAVVKNLQGGAASLGVPIEILNASTEAEIENVFATISQRPGSALLVGPDPFFTFRRAQIIALATRQALPTMYALREFAEAGGLIAYGPNLTSAYREAGTYTGRILKGEKPANIPVVQPTKFEMVINLKTAKALGLAIPDKLLALADEVIE